MSARNELYAYATTVFREDGVPPAVDRHVNRLIDAYRASVLREAADAINALPQDYECDPGRGDAADLLRRMADTAPAVAEDGQQ